jgi:hypothetical protein
VEVEEEAGVGVQVGEGEDRGATSHCIGKRRKVTVSEKTVQLGLVASVNHDCIALLKRVQSAVNN